jgi:hypothetical protein
MADLIPGFPTLAPHEVLTIVSYGTEEPVLDPQAVGRYLSLAFCNGLTVRAFPHVQTALKAKDWIDAHACGHACQRWHVVLDLETREYVTQSAFDLFTQRYAPLIDLDTRDPLVVRRSARPRQRHVLIPDLGTEVLRCTIPRRPRPGRSGFMPGTTAGMASGTVALRRVASRD